MNNLIKIISLLLCVSIIIALAGCQKKKPHHQPKKLPNPSLKIRMIGRMNLLILMKMLTRILALDFIPRVRLP